MIFKKEIELVRGDDGIPLIYNVPDRSDLETLFTNLPKEKQYWRRQTDFMFNPEFPNLFFDYDPHLPEKQQPRLNATKTQYIRGRLVSLSTEDTINMINLIDREVYRMANGIYIMNNGEKIYFPGFYYGALQWGKMFGVKGDGYGRHLKFQRRYAYVRDICRKEDWLDGFYCHKVKKSGITQLQTLFMMIDLITKKQWTCAAMSKVLDTAKKANFRYFMYAFKNLPPVLRPLMDNKTWAKQVQKLEVRCEDADFSLENTFAVVPTTVDGLDGLPIIQEIHFDELPKFPSNVPTEEVFSKSKEQVRQQSVKYGIISMTSYPPEEDTVAFKWCRDFYNESCKVVNGRPLNGIIPFFIGIREGSMHSSDIFGEPLEAEAEALEDAERAKCKDFYEMQARQRQYAKTAKEGWQSGGGGSVFDNLLLTEIEASLKEKYKNGEINFTEFNLEWTDGWWSPVRLVPITMEDKLRGVEGRWKLYCSLDYLKDKTNLAFKMPRKVKIIDKEKRLLLQPSDEIYFAGATDPVDYANTEHMVKGSMNASVIKNMMGDRISEYHYRHKDPDKTTEDLIMELLFFGHYSLVEGNRKYMFTKLESMGLCFFLLIRHTDGQILPYSAKYTVKPVNSSKDVISTYVTLIIKRLKQRPDQFVSLKAVAQLKEFDSEDTEATDLAVAEGLSEIALDAVQSYVNSKKSRRGRYEGLAEAMSAAL